MQAPVRPVPCSVRCAEDAQRVYKPFSKQQDAIAYAAACNVAAAQNGSPGGGEDPKPPQDIVKVQIPHVNAEIMEGCMKDRWCQNCSAGHLMRWEGCFDNPRANQLFDLEVRLGGYCCVAGRDCGIMHYWCI